MTQQNRLPRAAALLFLAVAGLSGCAVGPDYARPKVLNPERFKEAAASAGDSFSLETDWKVAEPDTVDTGPWWLVFDDALLNAFMPQLAMANQDAAAARANLRQARAAAREAAASFFPSVSGGGEVTRGQSGSRAPVGNAYRAQLSASWELDLFGGTRRETESAEALAEGSEAELAAVLLSMRAELAQNYFQLRSLDEQLRLYEQTIAAYEKSLAITRNQHAAGTVTRLDVVQAEAQYNNARAQAVDLDLQRRQTEHAIAALLGLPPALLSIAPAPLDAQLPRIEAPLPAALLERRPDVAAAERRMAAANARIGVAQSAYFPVFSLTGSGGYSSGAFRDWFSLPNRVWSVGAGLAQSLFQGGRLLARTDQAVAAWEASVATYRQSVLDAFREVEDQLAATALLEREEAMQREALTAAREAENLALSQYRGGIVNYLTVVSAQTTALTSARASATLKGRRFMAAVALIRSLGGGWALNPARAISF
ncbi:MAG: efflux transporter outer membrane subunit [Deltaproteobacteria bacterium]|jgi:NodT family efflux transporter outer membrane factor (OMF) lipoprotein|nr:efflux transporter outer membrane subunit [Deltaproteobacteria bacterium]